MRKQLKLSELILNQIQVRHVGPVNLQVSGGTIVCLSGGSGAGKSLLLRAIADMLPHDGEACLDDVCANTLTAPNWRKQVGLLPAETQWWYETVEQHFTDKNNTLLQAFGFEMQTWEWQVSRCSTGEKQRLGLLRLLSNQPRCLLLDEPTGSLDPENTLRVEQVITDYVQQHNAPVLWVSHSLEQIKRIANQHYAIRNGKLVKT